MGLKSIFQDACETIIDAFDDVPNTLAYHSLGTFHYNATTGTMTESGGSNITIKAIPDEIKSEEIQDRDIKMTDRKLLVANNDISVTPKVGDYTTIDGNRFNLIWSETDPAEALYTLYIREA